MSIYAKGDADCVVDFMPARVVGVSSRETYISAKRGKTCLFFVEHEKKV